MQSEPRIYVAAELSDNGLVYNNVVGTLFIGSRGETVMFATEH